MLSMHLILTTYPNKPRDCKKFIIGMIKWWFAACVQKINYAKSYYMRDDKLTQAEEKILLIKCSSTQKEKLLAYIKKQHPYEVPEIVVLKPEQVDEAYEKWIESAHKTQK